MINNNLVKSLIVSVTLFFLTVSPCFSEEMSYEQLLEKADEIKSRNPTELLNNLNRISEFENELTTKQLARLNYLKAYEKSFSGDIDSALTIVEQIDLSDSSPAFKAKLALYIANIAAIKEDWELALTNLTNGIHLAENEGSENVLASSYLTAALTFNLIYQHEIAFDFASKLLNLNLQGRTLCAAKQVLVQSGLYTKKIQPHSFEVDDAINTCKEIKEYLWANLTITYVAKALNERKQYKEAISSLVVNLASIEATKYPRLITAAYAELAYSYLNTQNIDKANFYAIKVLESPKSIEFSEPVVIASKTLYELAKIQHNDKEALFYFEKYYTADKGYLDAINARNIAYQVITQETKEKESTIQLLNKQNELLNNRNELLKVEQSLAQSEAENTRLIATLLMAIVTLLAFFGYRSWRTQKHLRVLAEYDYLTQTYNRGHFMALAEDTLKLAIKAKQTVTCIIFDLDKFKKINDTYGHDAGDWALKATVASVRECIRDNDILARLGGEEFVILLPSCDIQAATYVAEKCIKQLQKIDTSDSGHTFTITASFGVTTSKISGYNISALVKDADIALYQSKDSGRNRLTIFEKAN